ncbi:phospholipase A2 protein family [Purpureocillium lavendulum]|uniref:Phospholipase A2 protein family n=1 Tax=Purpureocillium lavendulum TaxID=1247861 RepID=A0AB34FFJ7_9HYPO|nr:phospholipase A2 protein family [Purpureocillium lavendulum]
MINELDLYTHPDATVDIKNALKVLHEQVKIVEGLEHARARLESTSSLDSNTLSKCNVFVRHVNNCTAGSSFDSELGAFEFPTARWRNIDNVFPKQTADAIHRAPQRFIDSNITDCVRSSFPRDQSDGDAIIWMDLDHLAMLSLLRDTRRGIRTSMVRDIFGDAIANAMEESDLRKWEKRNGSIETTACVRAKVFCHIELRIGCDSAIAKKLFN